MKKFLFAAALTATCGVAAAQGYAGALIGMGKVDVPCLSGLNCDNSQAGYKVYAGYELGAGWAAEVAYSDFGESEITSGAQTLKVKVTGISAAMAYRFGLTTDLLGVGRIGIGKLSSKQSGAITGLILDLDESAKLYLGLGLEYQMTNDVKLVGSYDVVGSDVSLLGVGAQIGF